jgi:transposase
MLIAHRIALDLNNAQTTYMSRAAGTARFAYNWALAEWKKQHDRFSLSNDQFKIEPFRVRVPGLGWVRMREALRFTGKVMSATVSRTADRWYASITVDTIDARPSLPEAENQGAVGVDLGVKALATLSTGEIGVQSRDGGRDSVCGKPVLCQQ